MQVSNTSKRCTRCLYDGLVPSITFDAAGVCNYCKIHDALDNQYPLGEAGASRLQALVDEMRTAGKGKKYDCVVGVSGGCDSSYLLHRLVEMGVRPLAAHFDNTWNSPIATQNIYNVLDKLKVELFTHVVNNKEYDDIYRAFMLSGVQDIDAPTDIGLASTLYLAAEKYGLKYIAEGHSFRTEGISPLGWLYMDGKYIESVHKQYGNIPMRTFPNLTLSRFLRWTAVRGIRRVRPLYHIDYRKEEAKRLLSAQYGWQWYGGHHLENRFTAFYHSFFMPTRFNVDQRILGYSALVRSGQLDRQEGFGMLEIPPQCPEEIIGLVKKRLRFSDADFETVMKAPVRTWRDFPTYKKTFERLRPFFWLMMKLRRVPESFYLKFCH